MYIIGCEKNRLFWIFWRKCTFKVSLGLDVPDGAPSSNLVSDAPGENNLTFDLQYAAPGHYLVSGTGVSAKYLLHKKKVIN